MQDQITYEMVASMPYLDGVVNESLRLYPPIQRFDRACTNCVENN
jgi:cytochrome P450